MSRGRDSSTPGQTTWEREVLYHHRVRTELSNERKYLGWLRVSLGLVTLGFVVERLDLFLADASGGPPPDLAAVLLWAPLAIFGLGGLTIAVATWEFFADRGRIRALQPRRSRLLIALVLVTLVSVVVIAVLLWLPGLHGSGPDCAGCAVSS
jgi:uncharacterized membrane protein YidH (DUF202 family)